MLLNHTLDQHTHNLYLSHGSWVLFRAYMGGEPVWSPHGSRIPSKTIPERHTWLVNFKRAVGSVLLYHQDDL